MKLERKSNPAASRPHGETVRNPALGLGPGEMVRVRDPGEILATLGEDHCLEGLPFMPEMASLCGGEFSVFKRLDKMIVEGRTGLRHMADTVLLEGAVCDGRAHSGCRNGCMMMWKEQWLARPDGSEPRLVITGARLGAPALRDGRFFCQATSIYDATAPLHFWNLEQYAWDIRDGIFNPYILLRTWLLVLYNRGKSRLGATKHYLFHGRGRRTPRESLGLQPGELVEVKSREGVAATLDYRGRNRGLSFAQEMLPFCGRRYRVLGPVEAIVVESTGRMQELADTVHLEGTHCDGSAHFNCRRNCRVLWKEIWLKRV